MKDKIEGIEEEVTIKMKKLVPLAYRNMTMALEGFDCRIGRLEKAESRPFSGVTTVHDFSAHTHRFVEVTIILHT